jgi:hypothetical protein
LRRTIGPSFRTSSMNDFEPTLKRYYNDFIDAVAKVAAKNGGAINISEWFSNLAFDVYPRNHFNDRFLALLCSHRILVLSREVSNISLLRHFI